MLCSPESLEGESVGVEEIAGADVDLHGGESAEGAVDGAEPRERRVVTAGGRVSYFPMSNHGGRT